MSRAARGAVIGGAVGALVAVAQTVRAETDPPEVVAVRAAKGLAQGALVGAVVGWLLDSPVAGWAADAYEAARGPVEGALEAAGPPIERTVGRVASRFRAA